MGFSLICQETLQILQGSQEKSSGDLTDIKHDIKDIQKAEAENNNLRDKLKDLMEKQLEKMENEKNELQNKFLDLKKEVK